MTTSIPAEPDLSALPALPRDERGPLFKAPWEAQAFAMMLSLYREGVFTWPEWAAALTDQLAQASARGEADDGSRYYEHWLAALEALVIRKKIVSADALEQHVQEWDTAARATPHGEAVVLKKS
jgi:nitrile hydratase accessory protein